MARPSTRWSCEPWATWSAGPSARAPGSHSFEQHERETNTPARPSTRLSCGMGNVVGGPFGPRTWFSFLRAARERRRPHHVPAFATRIRAGRGECRVVGVPFPPHCMVGGIFGPESG